MRRHSARPLPQPRHEADRQFEGDGTPIVRRTSASRLNNVGCPSGLNPNAMEPLGRRLAPSDFENR